MVQRWIRDGSTAEQLSLLQLEPHRRINVSRKSPGATDLDWREKVMSANHSAVAMSTRAFIFSLYLV